MQPPGILLQQSSYTIWNPASTTILYQQIFRENQIIEKEGIYKISSPLKKDCKQIIAESSTSTFVLHLRPAKYSGEIQPVEKKDIYKICNYLKNGL